MERRWSEGGGGSSGRLVRWRRDTRGKRGYDGEVGAGMRRWDGGIGVECEQGLEIEGGGGAEEFH